MKIRLGPLVFLGLTVALWLALRMPGIQFLLECWIPLAGWLVFGFMASCPASTAARLGVHGPTYGAVAATIGAVIPAAAAVLAALLLLCGRYLGTGADSIGNWATSPLLGAVFVLALLGTLVPLALMGDHNLGRLGTQPLADTRAPMSSHPPAPKSNAEFQSQSETVRDSSEDRRGA